MGDLVVQARGVGKRYDLGVTPSRHARGSLREALSRLPRRAWWAVRRPWSGESAPASAIWGVRGVSFDVNRGEILGIIGPNGSGKSTLLKVTAGITEPTEGWVATRGRVGSLLGVGAGFHPELTGRENVLLNGIILGMRASDVRRRFDEIVAFSGVERLLDTPVKHYSSGMYMRLAFSVAAHLEPDILIVDEVLAVGDAAFQEKCLGKMDEARVQGRTVLFVTHDMASVRRLCTHGLLLRQGRAIDHGPADEVAGRYLAAVDGAAVETGAAPAGPVSTKLPGALPGAAAWGTRLECTAIAAPGSPLTAGTPWLLRVDFEVGRPTASLVAAVALAVRRGPVLVTLASTAEDLSPGAYRTELVVDLPLAPGELSLSVHLLSGDRLLYAADDVSHVRLDEAPGGGRAPHGVRGLLVAAGRAPIVRVAPRRPGD